MNIPRLYISDSLSSQTALTLQEKQAHYATHVMRRKEGDTLLLFNGRDGEWQATITDIRKKAVQMRVEKQTRIQVEAPDIWLIFAPIKAGHLEFLVEKATELGVSRLLPVRTDRTIVSRVNHARLQAHAIEAAEQSERLDVPILDDYQPLSALLSAWDASRSLIYGDESGHGKEATQLLHGKSPPLALLIGAEGGFSPSEFNVLKECSFTHALSLGKRILRADTAALAGLTLIQSLCGDWK
jgi:16S rRNA (uracil1498-N3)-methyltransferase